MWNYVQIEILIRSEMTGLLVQGEWKDRLQVQVLRASTQWKKMEAAGSPESYVVPESLPSKSANSMM